MINSLITDTGFWYALLNKHDRYHSIAIRYMETCNKELITTWPVITETSYMLLSREGISETRKFLDMGALGFFKIFQLDSSHLSKVSDLMLKYADLPMDLADASLVLLAEELGHGRVLSTDQRDFNTYRWKNHKPFENLLLPN
jgi:predicted nucleic acid-binding protein